MSLSHLLTVIARFCANRAVLVMVIALALGLGAVGLASTRLGVSTDTDKLFADSLPWRRQQAEFNKQFPQFRDLLVMVIDARTPEEAEETADQLHQALAADPAHFAGVRQPDTSPYLQQNGLLFLDGKSLSSLLNSTIDAQPFLGQLAADPSARGLFAALNLLGIGVEHNQADLTSFRPALVGFHAALAEAASGHPEPLSWQSLLAGSLADKAGPYHFVLAQPRQDYGALQPGGAATDAVRAAAARLPAVVAGRAHVRITGSVALADEEFATVAQGAMVGLIGSFLVVILWLFLATRSARLVLAILGTLVLGLLLTTGFAAAAVGTLNLVSVAFAILFVGIAVDFAIQFSVRYREQRLHHPEAGAALAATAGRVGPQILVAAGATAAGFLAFVPTDFRGVAELGLIAGIGMLIAFACTLTFLPAALRLLHPRGEGAEIGFAFGDQAEAALLRVRMPVLVAFGVAALAGAVLLPRLVFDSDPLHTKNRNTEAVRTLYDLMASPLTNPYSVDVLRPDAMAADDLAKKLGDLPTVGQVVTLDSFVPEDQAPKLALIADAANLLAPTLAVQPTPPAPVTAEDLRMGAAATAKTLDSATAHLPKNDVLVLLDGDLHALADASDPVLLAANAALTRFLPLQLDRLRTALDAHPVTAADIPPEIARDWKLPDGRVRVQAVAKPTSQGTTGLRTFVNEVRAVAPDAGGSAVTIVETAGTIVGAFKTAALGALAAIGVILALVLGRLLDMALVMAPLLLSALLTALVAVLLPLPLNFANIIALPLLLGVGVSFNIYFVMNWRAGQRRMLGSATARAVVFSALTTGTAFGSLALSAHPGTASMGALLLLSLGCTLLATLAFLPAALNSVPRRVAQPAAADV